MKTFRVLIVEDAPLDFYAMEKELLRQAKLVGIPLDITWSQTLVDARIKVRKEVFCLASTDMGYPKRTVGGNPESYAGRDFLGDLKILGIVLPTVVYSNHFPKEVEVELRKYAFSDTQLPPILQKDNNHEVWASEVIKLLQSIPSAQ